MFCLPDALPDELLFSRIIRFNVSSGVPIGKVLLSVYGSPKACIHPYLTAGLSRFSDILGEDAKALLYHQTLAPIFMRCLPEHSSEIFSALLSNDNYLAIRSSQLSCVREREPLSLKLCPLCVKSDIYQYGVSYWHRHHQIPGIESCSRHSVWLVHVNFPHRIRTSIGLPTDSLSYRLSNPKSFKLAEYANKFLSIGEEGELRFGFDYYKERLRELGYVTKNGKIRRRLLFPEFYKFVLSLKYPSSRLLPREVTDYNYLSYLVCEHASQHPFKHILFSYWLNIADSIHEVTKTPPLVNIKNREHIKRRCLSLLKEGYSLAAISRKTNKSRYFVKSVALGAQIHKRLAPTKLTTVVQNVIIILAKKGFHRREIARRMSISTGSVELIISTVPNLVGWRKQCRYESMRRRYKVKILRYRQAHPEAIRRDIRSNCYPEFFWLYANERKWLERHLPMPTSGVSSNKKSTRV